jgi:hypothetical protein
MRYLLSLMLMFGMAPFSFGGECINGLCKRSSEGNSVRSKRVVVKTPPVVRRPHTTKK